MKNILIIALIGGVIFFVMQSMKKAQPDSQDQQGGSGGGGSSNLADQMTNTGMSLSTPPLVHYETGLTAPTGWRGNIYNQNGGSVQSGSSVFGNPMSGGTNGGNRNTGGGRPRVTTQTRNIRRG